MNPREVLTIIHDEMDDNKTTRQQIFCSQMTTKSFIRLFYLHVNLIGMVNHGHGDGTYTPYTIDMWPKGSLATRLKLKGIDGACTSCGAFVLI
jgi:hypothetical protein